LPTPPLPDQLAQEALDLVENYGSGHLAKLALPERTDLPHAKTIDKRAYIARVRGMRPTVRKDAPRIYTKERLGRMHVIVPDTQVKPGVNTDHLEWVGNFIAEKKPDVVIHLGDHWDMPSLSSYDKGKLSFEGRRYVHDVKAGHDGMRRLTEPYHCIKDYAPRQVFLRGNHCWRVVRFADEFPEMSGKVTLDDLDVKQYGFEDHPFLEVVRIDGIDYSHYFTSGAMGRPCSSAAVLLRTRQRSAIQGHVQHFDLASHPKTQQMAMFAGTCYTHDEDYLGPQGNVQRRQIVVLHEVDEGVFDPMLVSLKFLQKAYS
jgi:hypothetical protein